MMTDFEQLKVMFTELGIDTSKPGFYDHPKFLEAEKKGAEFLLNYAFFVNAKPYTPEYLQSARDVIVDLSDQRQLEFPPSDN